MSLMAEGLPVCVGLSFASLPCIITDRKVDSWYKKQRRKNAWPDTQGGPAGFVWQIYRFDRGSSHCFGRAKSATSVRYRQAHRVGG